MSGSNITVKIITDVSGFKKGLNSASSDVQKFGAEVKGHISGIGSSLIGLGAGFYGASGIIDGFKQSIENAVKFQQSMELLHTQAGATQQEVNKMSKALLADSPKWGESADEAAQGLYHIESAGLRGAKALDVLAAASKGAALGNANLEDVTNALDAVVVAGIKGVSNYSQAMGVLNATVGAGDMRMQDLADAMGTGILATAKTFGLTIQDVSGALATFGDNNIRGAEAGTRLRQVITLLGAPSNAAAKALAGVDITSTQLADDMRNHGLVYALTDLKQHLEASGLTASQQADVLAKAFGGGRTSAGILILLNQLDRLKGKVKEVGDGAGKFGKDWQAYTHTWAYQTKEFHGEITNLETAIGEKLMPVFNGWLKGIDKWLNTGDHQQQVINDVTTAVKDLAAILKTAAGDLKTVYGWVRDLDKIIGGNGGFTDNVKLLAGAWAAIKFASIISNFTKIGAAAGEAGAAGEVGLLTTKLNALKTMGPITIAIALAVTDVMLGKKVWGSAGFGADDTAGFAGGNGGSPYQKGSELDDAYQAGLHGGKMPVGKSALGAANNFTAVQLQSAYQQGQAAAATGNSVVANAKRFGAGSGAVYGSTTLGSVTGVGGNRVFDCSGYTYAVYTKAGYQGFPATSETQWFTMDGPNWTSKHIPASQAKPGDLAFTTGSGYSPPGHVGIVVSGSGLNADVMQYYSTGDPADTIKLSDFLDGKFGVKRFYLVQKAVAGGGKTGSPGAGASGSSASSHPGGSGGSGGSTPAKPAPFHGSVDGGASAAAAKKAAAKAAHEKLVEKNKEARAYNKYMTDMFAEIKHEIGLKAKSETDAVSKAGAAVGSETTYQGKIGALHKEADVIKKAIAEFKKLGLDPTSLENQLKKVNADIVKYAKDMQVAAGKKIVTSIEAVIKKAADVVKNDKTAGDTPAKIVSALRDELKVYGQQIDKLQKDIKNAQPAEKAVLEKELTKLNEGRKAVQAQLTAELKKEADTLAAGTEKAYKASQTKLQYLQVLAGDAVPGVTTDYTSAISDVVNKQVASLKAGIAKMKAKGFGNSTAMTRLESDLSTALANQESTLETAVNNAKTALSTATSKFDTAFGNLSNSVQSAFEQATQDYIDKTLGPEYFQNGLKTPAETALAAMQAQDQQQSLSDALATAQQQLASDMADQTNVTQDQIVKDQQAVTQAQRAIQENDLQIQATAERTKADADYAQAVKDYTAQRTAEEKSLMDSMTALQTSVDNGSTDISSLNSILGAAGLDPSTFGGAIGAVTDSMTGQGGVVDSLNAFKDALNSLVDWVNSNTNSNIQVPTAPSSNGSATAGSPGTTVSGYGPGGPIWLHAKGGIVTHPIYRNIIGENGPEAIIPLNDPRAAALLGGTGDVHIHFHGGTFIGSQPERVAKELVPHMQRELRRENLRNGREQVI